MGIEELATQAMAYVAGIVGSTVSGVASQRLTELISTRLAESPGGALAYMRMQQDPGDADLQQGAAAALQAEAEADPSFAASLREAFQAATDERVTGDPGKITIGGVLIGGNVRGRGQIAGRDINNSRRSIRIGLGALALLAVVGTGTAVYRAMADSQSPVSHPTGKSQGNEQSSNETPPLSPADNAKWHVTKFFSDVSRGDFAAACTQISPATLAKNDGDCTTALSDLLDEGRNDQEFTQDASGNTVVDYMATARKDINSGQLLSYTDIYSSQAIPGLDENHSLITVEFNNGNSYAFALQRQQNEWLIFKSTCFYASSGC
ncbi:hypothetical protein [Actinacidiphila sp. bgisy160]|uniref:hypothetical protein n=1 Tax=Actinacidiphila sp. bgisy160 TaxID=3413796 RepID=UPI003D74FBEA